MPVAIDPTSPITTYPLTIERWDDLVDLFGPERGANSGCWCMWPRITAKLWTAMSRDERRLAFRDVVAEGAPGILGYRDRLPVGWAAVGPRPTVSRFERSRISKPLDGDRPDNRIFALTCFYVRPGHRRQGITRAMTRAAIDFARSRGGTALDACAIDTTRRLVWGEGFVGIASMLREHGFQEVVRRSPSRPLMRLELQ